MSGVNGFLGFFSNIWNSGKTPVNPNHINTQDQDDFSDWVNLGSEKEVAPLTTQTTNNNPTNIQNQSHLTESDSEETTNPIPNRFPPPVKNNNSTKAQNQSHSTESDSDETTHIIPKRLPPTKPVTNNNSTKAQNQSLSREWTLNDLISEESSEELMPLPFNNPPSITSTIKWPARNLGGFSSLQEANSKNINFYKEQINKRIASLSEEEKILLKRDLLYYEYIYNPFYFEGSFSTPPDPTKLCINTDNYTITIKKYNKEIIKELTNEDIINLKTYNKYCQKGFSPIIESTYIDNHPIHSTLYKITQSLISSYTKLSLSEKIQNCEQLINEILFFCIENSKTNVITKKTLREKAPNTPEKELPYKLSTDHPPLEPLEIALRNHFMYAILDQERKKIFEQLAAQARPPTDINNKIEELYKFVTKNELYFFDKSNICERISDYNFHDLSKIMIDKYRHLNFYEKI